MNRMPSRYLLSRHLDMRLHVFAGWTRARLFTSADAARTGFIGDKKKKRGDRDGCEKEGEEGRERRKDRCGKKDRKNPSTDVVPGIRDQRRNDVQWSCLVYPNYIPFIPASATKGRVSHGNFLPLFLRMMHCALNRCRNAFLST